MPHITGPTKEDRALLRRVSVRSGADPVAVAILYERQFRRFVAGAYAVVGDPDVARDVVQEAFARALRERRRFRGDAPLEAWVWRIVVNVARDAVRHSAVAELTARELVEIAPLGEISDADGLRAQLRDLPERQRLAVFLHYYADLPYEEIAELLGVASGTVAASLNAARKTLRHRIEEAFE